MQFRRTRFLLMLQLAFIALSMTMFAGCAPKKTPEPTWEKEAAALLNSAADQYSRKQYDKASKSVETFLYQFPSSRLRDRAYFIQGDIRLAQRDYSRAAGNFKEIIEKYPSSPFIIQARHKLGQCYFQLGKYDLAIANLENGGRIGSPAEQKRVAEMLATAYAATRNHLAAVKKLTFLVSTAHSEKQGSDYRDTIRRIVEKDLSEEDVKTLAAGASYPADLAGVRLAGLQIERRNYREALRTAKDVLTKFPSTPEKMRAEALIGEAEAGLTAPRFSIAALLPQSGQLAYFGDRVRKGVELAAQIHNHEQPDNRVEIIVRDTEGAPEKAVAALAELAHTGIVAAVGPLLTREVEALAPLLESLKVPVVTPAASGEGIGTLSPWLFRNALTNSSQAAEAAGLANAMKLKKIAILHPDDAYGRDLSRLFARHLERQVEVLASVSYPSTANDFGPSVRKLIEIDLRSRKIQLPEDEAERKKILQEYAPGFDGLYLPGYAEKIGLLLPQLAYYNVAGIALIGSNNWRAPELVERADRHAEGAVLVDGFFPESDDPLIRAFVDAYSSAYQERPDILAAQAYDAAMMVFSLVREGQDTPQAVRDGLLALTDYHGVSGATTFPGNGEARKQLFLIQVQNGRFVPYLRVQ